jgi:hypothetical protein
MNHEWHIVVIRHCPCSRKQEKIGCPSKCSATHNSVGLLQIYFRSNSPGSLSFTIICSNGRTFSILYKISEIRETTVCLYSEAKDICQ